MSMKISKREKILLIVLAVVLIVGIYYRFVFSSQKEKLNSLIQQKDECDKKLQNINKQIILKNKTELDIKEINSKIKDMTSIIFPSINQESFIVYVNKLLEDNNLQGTALTFSDIKAVPVEEIKKDEKDDKTSSLKGIIDEYNGVPTKNKSVSNDKKTSNDNKNDNKDKPSAQDISLSINFKGSYANLLNFIKALEVYQKKIIVSNLQINQSTNDEVIGSMQLEFYAIPKILDDDKDFFNWDYKNQYGKDNPFDGSGTTLPVGTNSASSQVSQTQFDFLMSVKPISSDLPTIMLGKSKDTMKETYVYADNPGVENVEIYFTQNGDSYYYKYKTGRDSYPKQYNGEGEKFNPSGDSINLEIYSCKRNASSDTSGINLTLYNKTNKQVNILIDGDDTDRPRVSIFKEGNVSVRTN